MQKPPPGITEVPHGVSVDLGQHPSQPPHLVVGMASALQRGAAVAEGGFQHEVSGVFLCLAADVPQSDVHHVLDGLGEKNLVVTHWLGTTPCHPEHPEHPWVMLMGSKTPPQPSPPGGTWR